MALHTNLAAVLLPAEKVRQCLTHICTLALQLPLGLYSVAKTHKMIKQAVLVLLLLFNYFAVFDPGAGHLLVLGVWRVLLVRRCLRLPAAGFAQLNRVLPASRIPLPQVTT
jgi:hypothetical protein